MTTMSRKPPTASTELQPSAERTLVLCFDGTAEQYNGFNTNVVELFGLLKKDDFREQICYYQSGVGTYFNPGMVAPIFQWGAKVLDEAFAIYLNDHVMDGYRFLMENFHRGDKICIFGFSRGSYTARALAGMLHKVGLLPRDNQEQIPFAFKLYKDTSAAGIQLAAGYKQTFCQAVKVEFLGVWDTVSSVGVIMGRSLPFTSNDNTSIKTFRHAVSLDEHRLRYQPYLCEPKQTGDSVSQTDVLEVWFVGCHTDVGGGEVANGVPGSLSQITLRWMVNQVLASSCGILFDLEALARAGISPDGGPFTSNGEPSTDEADSSEALHDSLSGFSVWWLLELLPLPWSVQDPQGGWHMKFGFHLGKGRTVVDPKPNFHMTVKERMANAALKYKPKAIWTAGTEMYVD
ncbi:hypothetical protein B0H17DRAFT_185765 [Mycena rosella]|uniref:T6SS Phospholipase effector Tle1-like catalytic domain-containing protein n=1 Tax=Mycena rosella TaxID=1033263 RepID=A0AAD7DXL1_MYCRO|nr:hypothetical protein B0H17DRAFT_185765 [Mycena rosella]